jgi:hypothetical protein
MKYMLYGSGRRGFDDNQRTGSIRSSPHERDSGTADAGG